MSDLSNLFKPQLPIASLSASYYQPSKTSLRTSTTRSEHWNIGDLQQKVRLGVRKQVEAESMREQLRIFYSMQREVVFKKILLIGAIGLLLYTSNIQGSSLVIILLLMASQLFSTTILPINNLMVSILLNKLQHLIYFSVFYTLLKWVIGNNNRFIDWTLTFTALVGTISHLIIQIYSPFFIISSRAIIGEAVRQKTTISKTLIFGKYLIHRIRMILGLAKYLIVVVSILSIIILGVFAYFKQITIQFFQLSNILISIPTFVVLELFFNYLTFVNLTMSQDLKLSKIMKDKIPMFLNLLRLQCKPLNRLVQLQCLKCIYIKTYQSSNFLSNETNKSLLYTTYMDIFNQYAVIQMQRVTALMMEFNTNAKINDKVVNTSKSIFRDIFIYIRKKRAEFLSEWQMLRIIEMLASLNYLFLIINKIEIQSEQQDIKISGRILHLVKMIKQRLGECAQRVSLSAYARGELTSLYLNFSSYQFWIKDF